MFPASVLLLSDSVWGLSYFYVELIVVRVNATLVDCQLIDIFSFYRYTTLFLQTTTNRTGEKEYISKSSYLMSGLEWGRRFLSTELSNFFCNDLGLLFLCNHDFEAIEIGQVSTNFLGS